MLADCAAAKDSIVLEQFIFYTDDFGKKLIDICAERAKAGVKVRFLWDAVGSFSFMGSNIAADLRTKGIRLVFWRTLIPGYFTLSNFRSWFLRNHRRTLVIDGRVGYTGSICIKDAMRNWRDTNARFEGPVVTEMAEAFERMWARAVKNRYMDPWKRAPLASGRDFRYETNYPAPGGRRLYRALVEAVRNAHTYVYLTTPYFVPTRRLARVIRLAARRGVDVRILIPDKSNYFAIDLGARSFFTPLLEARARIFLYPNKNGESLVHGKTAVVDGHWSTLGSLNLDHVSLLYNFEANIVSTDPRFAEELEAHFIHDMQKSQEVALEDWKNRFFLEKLPEYAIRLVRKFL